MIFVLDNYDSFTYNLVQYLGTFSNEIKVVRNDQITIKEIEKINPNGILISPGPKTPKEAGISKEIVNVFSGKIPILGVCLGHQVIGECFGGEIVRAKNIMHGKVSIITHNKKGIFKGLPDSFTATRYHSLIVNRENLPDTLEITAESNDGYIMGIIVKKHPNTWGVQFHPESVLTEHGMKMIENFYKNCVK
ncbi:MAG: aminodeoxychorismate/anthranilate synthase component II [Spirochaetia bacterium]|nr:aminodeoxychorismate/anthranilate synthase component II [Spirochaetia bacterium]